MVRFSRQRRDDIIQYREMTWYKHWLVGAGDDKKLHWLEEQYQHNTHHTSNQTIKHITHTKTLTVKLMLPSWIIYNFYFSYEQDLFYEFCQLLNIKMIKSLIVKLQCRKDCSFIFFNVVKLDLNYRFSEFGIKQLQKRRTQVERKIC